MLETENQTFTLKQTCSLWFMQQFSYPNNFEINVTVESKFFLFLGRKPSKAELLQARGLHPFHCYGSHQRTFTLLLWTENNGSKLPSKCYTSLEIFRRFPSDRITKKTFKALRGTTSGVKKSQLKHPKRIFRYLSFNNDQLTSSRTPRKIHRPPCRHIMGHVTLGNAACENCGLKAVE